MSRMDQGGRGQRHSPKSRHPRTVPRPMPNTALYARSTRPSQFNGGNTRGSRHAPPTPPTPSPASPSALPPLDTFTSTEDALAAYLLDRRRRNFSPATLKNHRTHVLCLARTLSGLGFDSVLDPRVTAADIADHLDSRGLEGRSRYTTSKALQAFYRFCADAGLIAHDPTVDLALPRVTRYLPHPIPESELAFALSQSSSPRMYAWLVLCAFAGLRVSEIAGLRADALVDLGNGLVLRIRGKGVGGESKERLIPAHRLVLAALTRYPADAHGRAGRWFLRPQDARHSPGRPYTPRQVSDAIAAHLRRCNPATTHTAHSLRHRFATVTLAACGDLRVVQELLGHADLSTTSVYTQVAIGRLVDAVHAIPAV